jgi:hypothetical protein
MTMKQIKTKSRNHKNDIPSHTRRVPPRRERSCAPAEIDEPEVPIHALLEIADYALDTALTVANDDPDDVAAIERVRRYMHRSLKGGIAEHPAESDFLTVLALAVAAMEKRHGIVGLGETVAEAIDHIGYVAPHACSYRRAPRVTRHLYCVP